MKVRFAFQSEGLWMMAFPLVPGIIVVLLLLLLRIFGFSADL